ncbi:MAG: DUF1330 domain-containing protein [Candidatus Omnitrophica bacterium]|nr:DUF1330 domain-containing protein [Candidatus Omnitrophota bacterium]
MSVYFLAEITKIIDKEMYTEYIKKARLIVLKFGGKYVLKSDKLIPVTGDWNLERVILIKFESKEKMQECFQSAEYKAVKQLRVDSTESKALIIEE